MSISIIYDYQIFSEQEYGGISRYIYEIAKRIYDTDGYDVSILSPLYINEYLKQAEQGLVVGKHINKMPKMGRVIKYIDSILSEITLNKRKPDILHETYYQINSLARKSKNTKTVLTVHDMIHEKFPEYFNDSKLSIKIKSQAIDRSDQVICVSENTKMDLLEYTNISEEKISVIHHGYPELDSLHRNEKPLISNPYILFVGQRWGYKNFDRFLEAFAKYTINNDFSLICFGGGEMSRSEIERMHKLGLNANDVIQISGDDTALSNIYTFASAFINPSIYEGFGMPLLEAMSHQCPVICSNASSFPEVAGNAAEYFDPFDIDSIGTAIKKVLYSSVLGNNMVKLGNENLTNYSWDKCSQETISVYMKIL